MSLQVECKVCSSTNLIYGGTVKGNWYCYKHWNRADSLALIEDYHDLYYLDERGIAHGK